ncbi:RNA helicase [Fusarium mundagurra]|uniref:ATP-dependent RNA helicase n=1 Tax=Fusarium mundagurra TaxID=1567541 RepID=A0A8H5YG48_9HYPO|nr:RNA helicase [Fusarium mundagurra]
MADPAGTAGTALGATSLFLQIFQGCVDGFSVWQKGEALASDALIFKARLEMQAARFKAWGLDWGFDRGPDAACWRDDRFIENGDLAVKYVVIIYGFLDSLGELSQEFPALASAENVPVSAATSLGRMLRMAFKDSQEREEWARKLEVMRDEAKVSEKLRWALKEGEIIKTLELLESMIDDLCKFFKPPENDPVALQVANSLLSSLNISKLNAVAAGAPDDSMLQSLALLKVMVLQFQLGARNAEKVDEKDRSLRETGLLDERTKRSTGVFRKGTTSTDVLVEWKLIDGSHTPPGHTAATYRAMAGNRIKNLARLLKRSSRLEDLRTLDCIGVITRDGLSDDEVRYGTIFNMPTKKYTTLKNILEGPQDNIYLDDWFKVAKSVTRAVLCLHLAGWLHKGLRSENILYFQDDSGDISYEEPYLAGFEYSREISAPGQTEGVTDDLEANLYRHEEVQGVPEEPSEDDQGHAGKTPFAMKHDIYSIGILLLELGLPKPIIQLYEEAIQTGEYEHSATAFREWILSKALPKLGRSRGKEYMRATELCLKSEFEGASTDELQQAFYKSVHTTFLPPFLMDSGSRRRGGRGGGNRRGFSSRGGGGRSNQPRNNQPRTPKIKTENEDVEMASPSLAPVPAPPLTEEPTSRRFDSLLENNKVNPLIVRTITDDMKFEFMTPVQAATMDELLPPNRSDCLVQARTGTGKTMAFLIPALQTMINQNRAAGDGISLLVISPTRELALQISAEAKKVLQGLPKYRVQVAIGGTNKDREERAILAGCEILIATPGRLLDHMSNEDIVYSMRKLNTLVLDEADRLLDMGFMKDLRDIVGRLPDKTKSDRQGMLFSATIAPHVEQVAGLVLSPGYKFISTIPAGEANTHERVPQFLVQVPTFGDVAPAMVGCIREEATRGQAFKAILFAPTAAIADFYGRLLEDLPGLPPVSILHSRMSQNKRTKITNDYRTARNAILVATDVVARGMDFPGVTTVIQVGMPADKQSYIHRLGRTARADAEGRGILIVSDAEGFFPKYSLKEINLLPREADLSPSSDVISVAEKMEDDEKSRVYQAWLGYYNSHMKSLRWDKEELVRQANVYAREGLGSPDVPTIQKSTASKMGLRGVRGLNTVADRPRQKHGASGGHGDNGRGKRGRN